MEIRIRLDKEVELWILEIRDTSNWVVLELPVR